MIINKKQEGQTMKYTFKTVSTRKIKDLQKVEKLVADGWQIIVIGTDTMLLQKGEN